LDAIYVINLVKIGVDLSAIAIAGYNSASLQLFAPSVPSLLTPAFDPLVHTYSLQVSFSVKQLTMSAMWASASNSVRLTMSGVASVTGVSLASGSDSLFLQLAPGLNTITIDSELDGQFVFAITRSVQDLIGISITDSLGFVAGDLQYAPAFASGVAEYILNVPFVALLVTLQFRTLHADSKLACQRNALQWTAATIETVQGGETTHTFDVANLFISEDCTPLQNRFLVSSVYDDTFAITIFRAQADLQAIAMQATTLGADVAGQAAMQLLPSNAILTQTTLSPSYGPLYRAYKLVSKSEREKANTNSGRRAPREQTLADESHIEYRFFNC
jgi:hypothetical protein